MNSFADLYGTLDETTKTRVKVRALVRFFEAVSAADAAWAIYFLTGRKPKQIVPTKLLRQWAAEVAGLPTWLFEESYHAVGDLAETMALLVPSGVAAEVRPLQWWIEERLLPLRERIEDQQKAELLQIWSELDTGQRLVWNKLITGAFRVGVSQQLVIQALAQVSDIAPSAIAHRLMGNWQPTAKFYENLVARDTTDADPAQPYPFFLASPLECEPVELGEAAEWLAEWKWDGIRSQLIHRQDQVFLWSRGEELITERFPEITAVAAKLPQGTVIDGEVLPWGPEGVRPFAELQKRIGRKNITKKILAEVPVILLAYDLLEADGVDWRDRPLAERRRQLGVMIHECHDPRLQLSPVLDSHSFVELAALRQEARQRQVEGLMLKRKSSSYRVGRVRGDWWKWKIDPLTVDAVLIYAQRGSGKRASLYTDYTFAVWHDDKLVSFAKAYSGLTDAEIRQVDQFVKANTVEKFGPVRTVKPELVFEIAFEGIQKSTRHKSGIAVRFPRIARWRHDKSIADADQLTDVMKLLTTGV